MNGRFSYEFVKEYIESFNYKLVSKEYTNIKSELRTICPNGHEYVTTFKNFRESRRCPKCRKVSFETVKENVEGMGYILLTKKEDFKNTRTPIIVKCKEGHIIKRRYDSIVKGNNCIECENNSRRNTYEYVKNFVENQNYELLDDKYVNNSTHLKMKCPNNHIVNITFGGFKNGNRCKECCHDNYRLDYNDVKEYIELKGYKVISEEYKNLKEKLHLVCPSGHDYFVSFATFKWSGCDCPLCSLESVSKGEKIIIDFLENNNIEYIKEYKFNDCKDKRELPFDFYIPKINTLIEFDGEQHFKAKSKFGDLSFTTTVYHDAIKNSYCEDSGIKLLRIPYWELKNISDILKQHIK